MLEIKSGGNKVFVSGNSFQMLPEKVLYWEEQQALILADAHFGKVSHFRKGGIGIPASAAMEDIERLEMLIVRLNPKNIFFLGDFFHSTINREWEKIIHVLAQYQTTKKILILGNHDILSLHIYKEGNIEVVQEPFAVGNINLCHHPQTSFNSSCYYLCGHVHPSIRISGKGKQSLKLPAFIWGGQQGILPAFANFSGSHVVEIEKGMIVYGIAGKSVVKINE